MLTQLLGSREEKTKKPERGGGLSAALSDLQVSWLRNLQPYNPEKDELAAWCESVGRLLPPNTSAKDALGLVVTRLPNHLGDMLQDCIQQSLRADGPLCWPVLSTYLSAE